MFFAKYFSAQISAESLVSDITKMEVLGKKLPELQDWAVLLAKGQWAQNTQAAQLWIRQDVYLTSTAIEQFVQTVQGKEGNFAWRAKDRVGNFVEEIAFADTRPMLVWTTKPCVELPEEVLQHVEVLEVDVNIRYLDMPVPESHLGVNIVQLPVSDSIVMPTGHWSQVLWTNLFAMESFLLRELLGHNIGVVLWRLCKAVLQMRSFRKHKLIGAYVQQGTDCRIHPSAVVEGCLLGNNVVIGANAVVRGSVLRDNVRVEDLALVEGSVLSPGVVVQRQAMVKFSVLSEKSSVAGVVQLGVLGEGASLKRGAYLMDLHFSGPVRVLHNRVLKEAVLGMLGVCVQEHTAIGLGVRIAAGRLVPPMLDIVMNPADIVRDVEVESIAIPSNDGNGDTPTKKRLCVVNQGKLVAQDNMSTKK
jgi:hypothetical protein